MIARRAKRDPLWERVEGGILRDENGWAVIRLAVTVDGQRLGWNLGIKHERILDPDSAFRRTLDQMTREIDVMIKYRKDFK